MFCIIKFSRLSVISLFVSGLIACGGGGGGGSATSDIKEGVFLDSPVQGLRYVTDTLTGTTDANGTFTYRDGEVIRFYVGDGLIGIAPGKATVTPMDFALQPSETATEMLNPLRVVQTLDTDSDPSNGITLPEIAAGTGATLDISNEVSVQSFINAVDASAILVDSGTALTHFGDTLDNLAEAAPADADQFSYQFSHAYSNELKTINTTLTATLDWVDNDNISLSISMPSGYQLDYQGEDIFWNGSHAAISLLDVSPDRGIVIATDINSGIEYSVWFDRTDTDNRLLECGYYAIKTHSITSLVDTRTYSTDDFMCINQTFDGDYIDSMYVEFYLDGAQTDLDIYVNGQHQGVQSLSFDVAKYQYDISVPTGRGALLVDYQLDYKIIAIDSNGGRFESTLKTLHEKTTDGTGSGSSIAETTYTATDVFKPYDDVSGETFYCRYSSLDMTFSVSDTSGNTSDAVSGSYALSGLTDLNIFNPSDTRCPSSDSRNFTSTHTARLDEFGAFAFRFIQQDGTDQTCGYDLAGGNVDVTSFWCGDYSINDFPDDNHYTDFEADTFSISSGTTGGTGGDSLSCSSAWTGDPADVQISTLCEAACVYAEAGSADAATQTCGLVAGFGTSATASCTACN